jgi:hypothetical protein
MGTWNKRDPVERNSEIDLRRQKRNQSALSCTSRRALCAQQIDRGVGAMIQPGSSPAWMFSGIVQGNAMVRQREYVVAE